MSLNNCPEGMRLLHTAARTHRLTQELKPSNEDFQLSFEADRVFSEHANSCPICNQSDRLVGPRYGRV
jgi:hypothetical protein